MRSKKKKRLKKSKGGLRALWDIIKWTNIHMIKVMEGEERKGESYSKK